MQTQAKTLSTGLSLAAPWSAIYAWIARTTREWCIVHGRLGSGQNKILASKEKL